MPGPYDVDLSNFVEDDLNDRDDNGNIAEEAEPESNDEEEESEEESSENSDDESEDKSDDEKESGEQKEGGDDEGVAGQISDDTEFAIEDEKVPFSRLVDAYTNERDRHADYTRKTQELARRRDGFDRMEKNLAESHNRIVESPQNFIEYYKRRYPDLLLDAMISYGTEYADLQEIAKENPAEYQRRVNQERSRLDQLNRQEDQDRANARERMRIEEVIFDNRDRMLNRAGLLPEKCGKAYRKLVMDEFFGTYMEVIKSSPERVTEQTIKKIVDKMATSKELKEELKLDQSRYKTAKSDDKKNGKNGKDKPNLANQKKKLHSVGGQNAVQKVQRRQKPDVTHENFFDMLSIK